MKFSPKATNPAPATATEAAHTEGEHEEGNIKEVELNEAQFKTSNIELGGFATEKPKRSHQRQRLHQIATAKSSRCNGYCGRYDTIYQGN